MVYRTKAVAALFLLCVSAPVFADSGTFDHTHCFTGTTQTLKHSDGNVVNAVSYRGTVRAVTPGQVFDNMSSQCVGLYGQVEGNTFSQGFCEFFDNDSDRIFFRYQRVGMEGTFHAVRGMGKYNGMTLDGTYSVMRFPQTPGFLQGCAQNKGQWER
jgi:hypothetical protein